MFTTTKQVARVPTSGTKKLEHDIKIIRTKYSKHGDDAIDISSCVL